MCVGGLDEDLGGIELRKKAKPRLINSTIRAIIFSFVELYLLFFSIKNYARRVEFMNRGLRENLISRGTRQVHVPGTNEEYVKTYIDRVLAI